MVRWLHVMWRCLWKVLVGAPEKASTGHLQTVGDVGQFVLVHTENVGISTLPPIACPHEEPADVIVTIQLQLKLRLLHSAEMALIEINQLCISWSWEKRKEKRRN